MGAAIVVENHNHHVPYVYSRLHFNPLCFLQYEDKLLPPEKWENVSRGNSRDSLFCVSDLKSTEL